MTLQQLKRHVDRRFDRLQRTKADKADLTRFTTKSEVRRLRKEIAARPTKDDLKRELERFAAKDALAQLATRVDANAAEMNRRFDSLNEKIDGLLRLMLDRFDQQEALIDRVYVEHGNRLADLERHVGIGGPLG